MIHPHIKAAADVLTRQTSQRDFDRCFDAIVTMDRLVKEQDPQLDMALADPNNTTPATRYCQECGQWEAA